MKPTEIGTINILSDGTCTVAGETFYWEVVSRNGNVGTLLVQRDGTPVYEFGITYIENDCDFLFLYKYTDGNTSPELISDTFYRANDLQKLVVTMDNWQEYFTVKSHMHLSYNAFGELDQGDVNSYLVLNPDKNITVNDQISRVALEYRTLHGWASVDTNMETFEYTYSFNDTPYEENVIDDMGIVRFEDKDYYGVSVGWGTFIDFPLDNSVAWKEFSDVLRIEGVIYYPIGH